MNCPICGTILKETNLGRYFCPNCGIIDNNDIADKEDKIKRPRDYIG